MTIKFPRLQRFGLGFGPVPVRWMRRHLPLQAGHYRPWDGKAPAFGIIEMSGNMPLWEQVIEYGHEVLHSAIDFDRYCTRLAMEMKDEADKTARELHDDE